ncbi:MAG: (2Fe-2S)-binding protein [bacterium]|jgi:aerobic-type carbon monoxide dehydrogenase small subunit (CoxS/CutS family)|nr:(2Fe-2S)-binding protein [Betaproteobacteria bacterium]
MSQHASMREITLHVNGEARTCTVADRSNLADFLRHDLQLTGTHVGCEHGVCGACTVLVDGRSVRGCLMLAVQADGCSVETVESLAAGTQGAAGLGPLQQAFRDRHALQCGYCTPGILMSLTELLRDDPAPDEQAVRLVLSGHLCRCTGYQNIVAAALQAASKPAGDA